MTNIRKMIPKVEARIKQADPEVITERTFYDEVSDRLFVTIVKGPRKTEIMLLGRDFGDAQVDRAVAQGVARLEHTPIG
jgi:hypothetical protein